MAFGLPAASRSFGKLATAASPRTPQIATNGGWLRVISQSRSTPATHYSAPPECVLRSEPLPVNCAMSLRVHSIPHQSSLPLLRLPHVGTCPPLRRLAPENAACASRRCGAADHICLPPAQAACSWGGPDVAARA
eukprot:NODE_9189_length_1441_cov_2.322679.p3 GENE.NODE_9189_length_1441_cov_2.322679~~NODE_9189_length_1441_cov_2.322679.p3  ORF type:complete len:135 (-),score=19.12 NODE_9189_length_1441_cov_2.322679:558-962(-)